MYALPNIVDAVLVFLGLLSLLVWTISISKAIRFYRNTHYDRQFRQDFESVRQIKDLPNLVMNAKGALARLCIAGIKELRGLQQNQAPLDQQSQKEILLHAMQEQAEAEQNRMENGLGVLASVGSTAPFIGLFGTVWGIMHALKNISASGSAGLDVVAGPIGEALIATAIGIATAVPAVLAYNYFLRKVNLSSNAMDNFATSFQLLVVKSSKKGE